MQALGTRKAIGILLVVVAFGLIANLVAFWIVPAVMAAQQTFRNTQTPSPLGVVSLANASIIPLSSGGTAGMKFNGPWAIYGVTAFSGNDSGTMSYGGIAVGYVEFGANGEVYNVVSRNAWEATPPQTP